MSTIMNSTAEAEVKVHNFVGTQIKILMGELVYNVLSGISYV